MNTCPRWVRIHNQEERLPRASKRICPKMRPHPIRRRRHLPKIFPLSHKFVRLSRKFSRIVSDIFVSQAIVHMQLGGGTSKTWHKSKLDTSQNLTSFLSIKILTRQNFQLDLSVRFRRTSRCLVVLWMFYLYPFLSSCRATDVATGRACHDPKDIARRGISLGKKKLCIRVPPPHHRIGRPHIFSNLTSLELPAAALGGIGVRKNCHLLGIVDNLEL